MSIKYLFTFLHFVFALQNRKSNGAVLYWTLYRNKSKTLKWQFIYFFSSSPTFALVTVSGCSYSSPKQHGRDVKESVFPLVNTGSQTMFTFVAHVGHFFSIRLRFSTTKDRYKRVFLLKYKKGWNHRFTYPQGERAIRKGEGRNEQYVQETYKIGKGVWLVSLPGGTKMDRLIMWWMTHC